MKKMVYYFLAVIFISSAGAAEAVTVSLGIPGVTPTTPPEQFIGKIYEFALILAGVLALGAMVYGGVKYMTAVGSPSGQGEGREWIKAAVFGLALLFGAYLILYIINPEITNLSLPTLNPITPPSASKP